MIFVDGFDHYDDDIEGGTKWDIFQLATVNTTGGRNNSGYVSLITGSSVIRKHFASATKVILQMGYSVDFSGGNDWTVCGLYHPIGGDINRLSLLSDGSLRYVRGNPDVPANILATSAGGTMSGGVWHYLEIEQIISQTVGTLLVKLNGNIIFNLTGLDNNDDPVEFPTQMAIGGKASSAVKIDDLVLITGSEAAPFNALFGDWAVRTLYPNGVGSINQFTPVPVVANHLNVDETYPDGDTTYVEASTVGFRDLYAMTDLPATVSSVLSVTTTPRVKKSDAGTRQFRGLIHRAGTTDATGDIQTATAGYAMGLQNTFRFDPITGVAPTPAQVNAYESGYEVVT